MGSGTSNILQIWAQNSEVGSLPGQTTFENKRRGRRADWLWYSREQHVSIRANCGLGDLPLHQLSLAANAVLRHPLVCRLIPGHSSDTQTSHSAKFKIRVHLQVRPYPPGRSCKQVLPCRPPDVKILDRPPQKLVQGFKNARDPHWPFPPLWVPALCGRWGRKL